MCDGEDCEVLDVNKAAAPSLDFLSNEAVTLPIASEAFTGEMQEFVLKD